MNATNTATQPAPDRSLFATLARGWLTDGTMLRTSFFQTLEAAIERAEESFGVEAIEEIGAGIVWTRPIEPREVTPC